MDPFLCSFPGLRKRYFYFNIFQIHQDRVVSIGCGVCPLAARSVTIRLQWLVEHSGVDLSPLAEALNHFSSQLCNLSPTSAHKTASLWCLPLHVCSRLASPVLPPAARHFCLVHGCARDKSFTEVRQGINHTICDSLILANTIKKTAVNWSFIGHDSCNWRLFSSAINRLFVYPARWLKPDGPDDQQKTCLNEEKLHPIRFED